MSVDYKIYAKPLNTESWIDNTSGGAGANPPVGYPVANLANTSIAKEFRTGTSFGDGDTTQIVLRWDGTAKASTQLSAILVQRTNASLFELEYVPAGGASWESAGLFETVFDAWGNGRALLALPDPYLVDDIRVTMTVVNADVSDNTADGANFWRIGALHWFQQTINCNWPPAQNGIAIDYVDPVAQSDYLNGRNSFVILGPGYSSLKLAFQVASNQGNPEKIIKAARHNPFICIDFPHPKSCVMPATLDERAYSFGVRQYLIHDYSLTLKEVVHTVENFSEVYVGTPVEPPATADAVFNTQGGRWEIVEGSSTLSLSGKLLSTPRLSLDFEQKIRMQIFENRQGSASWTLELTFTSGAFSQTKVFSWQVDTVGAGQFLLNDNADTAIPADIDGAPQFHIGAGGFYSEDDGALPENQWVEFDVRLTNLDVSGALMNYVITLS